MPKLVNNSSNGESVVSDDWLASLIDGAPTPVPTTITKQEERDAVRSTPPEDFKEVGEDIETTCQCPRCGYRWS